jgi:hypothetical protein
MLPEKPRSESGGKQNAQAYSDAVFRRTRSIPSRVCENPMADASSSFLTSFKKSHSQHDARFCSSSPCTFPPHRDPLTTQHALPAFFPPCMPFNPE